MDKYKKNLTELEKKLAKLLSGKEQAEPDKAIAKRTADIVSVAGAFKPFKLDKIFSKFKVKPSADKVEDVAKQQKLLKKTIDKIRETKLEKENEKLKKLIKTIKSKKKITDFNRPKKQFKYLREDKEGFSNYKTKSYEDLTEDLAKQNIVLKKLIKTNVKMKDISTSKTTKEDNMLLKRFLKALVKIRGKMN